jgi:hypothetical protein
MSSDTSSGNLTFAPDFDPGRTSGFLRRANSYTLFRSVAM